jgi:hypothetical protein
VNTLSNVRSFNRFTAGDVMLAGLRQLQVRDLYAAF